jgi:hypothetical protein
MFWFLFSEGAYYFDLIRLLKKAGYVSGLNLFGFPYDWRQPLSLPAIHDKLMKFG